MGVYSDFLAHTGVVDVTGEKVANQRSAYGELAAHASKLDPACPSFLTTKDAVQVINAFTPTVASGSYTITIVDELGTEHTTGSILFIAYLWLFFNLKTLRNIYCPRFFNFKSRR